MKRVKFWIKRLWRFTFALLAVAVPVTIIGRATSHPPLEQMPIVVSLTGAHFGNIQRVSNLLELPNASVQTVTPVSYTHLTLPTT